jgi:hypothetical protein
MNFKRRRGIFCTVVHRIWFLLAWRMDIRRLHWKALQTPWTVSRKAFLRPAYCETLPVSVSLSDQLLMYCPAGIVCPNMELMLPWIKVEQRACIEAANTQSENISQPSFLYHMSIGNAVFHFWQFFFSNWKANSWLDKQFQQKREFNRLVAYLDENVRCRISRQTCIIWLLDYW